MFLLLFPPLAMCDLNFSSYQAALLSICSFSFACLCGVECHGGLVSFAGCNVVNHFRANGLFSPSLTQGNCLGLASPGSLLGRLWVAYSALPPFVLPQGSSEPPPTPSTGRVPGGSWQIVSFCPLASQSGTECVKGILIRPPSLAQSHCRSANLC